MLWFKKNVPPVNRNPEMVAEFDTGIMILKETAIEREAIFRNGSAMFGFRREDGRAFFRAGSKCDWSYVVITNGEPKFFKRQKDVEVDRSGDPISASNDKIIGQVPPTPQHKGKNKGASNR